MMVASHLQGAELASGLEAEDTESLGDNHLLLAVVGRGDTLEDLEALESGGSARGLFAAANAFRFRLLASRTPVRDIEGRETYLVGDHTTDGLVEDAGRSAEVERTRLLGVDQVTLVEVVVVTEL